MEHHTIDSRGHRIGRKDERIVLSYGAAPDQQLPHGFVSRNGFIGEGGENGGPRFPGGRLMEPKKALHNSARVCAGQAHNSKAAPSGRRGYCYDRVG